MARAVTIARVVASVLLAVSAGAQTPAGRWTPARTPWGDPDLQGTYNNNDEFGTPFERPDRFAGRRLSEVTAQELSAYVEERRSAGPKGPFSTPTPEHWAEGDESRNRRPWMIVDPADGKIPPLTPDALQRRAQRAADATRENPSGALRSYTDLSLLERCISLPIPLAMRAGASGNVYEIVQSPGIVAIRYEQMHETRLIRINGRGHVSATIRSHSGDSVGHWEGSDLVVETTNLSERSYSGYPGIRPETLRMVERWSPVAPDRLDVTVTYDDAAAWVRSWSWQTVLIKDQRQSVLEYGCHEGNLALRHMLSGARALDR